MRIVLLTSLFVGFISLISCKKDVSSLSETDTVLDIRLDRDPVKLNPIVYPKVVVRQINNNIFLPLADRDPESLDFVPILITEIPAKNKRADGSVSFDLTIRPDAEWPNKRPITGYDYLFTVKAISHPLVNAPAYRSYADNITSIDVNATNPKEFTVVLREDYLLALESVITLELYPAYAYDPYGRLNGHSLASLKDPNNLDKIKSDTSLMNFAEDMNGPKYGQETVVGAGPYAFLSYEENKYVRLEKRENYWGEKHPDIKALQAGPTSITFHVIPDMVNALSLIKDGSIDFINDIDGSNYSNLQSSEYAQKQLAFLSPEMPRSYYLMLNTKSDQLSEKAVRKALYHLVDIPTLINVLESGGGTIEKSPIRSTASYYLTSLPDPEFNIQKAKDILEANGWVDTDNDGIRDKVVNGKQVSLSLKTSAAPKGLSGDIAQILKSDAEQAGIAIELIEKSPNLFKEEHIKTGNYHIAAQAETKYLSLYDPYQKWHSDNLYKGSNYSGYSNAEIDQIIDKIRRIDQLDSLTPLYHRFQTILYEDLPHIYLYSPTAKMAVRKNWEIIPTVKRPGYLANTAKAKSK